MSVIIRYNLGNVPIGDAAMCFVRSHPLRRRCSDIAASR